MLLAAAIALISISSCKKKISDAELKTSIETALRADPMSEGTTVSVEKGVATISGTCKDDACKTHCAELVRGIKGVKEVVNNCTIAPPPPPVEIAADDPLTKAVADALKAYPKVSSSVKDGVITLTGEIAKNDLQKLMMSLQALKPKKVDASALIKK